MEGEIMVLEDHVGYEDFLRVAKDLGLALQETQEGDGEVVAHQEIWATADGESGVNYIDDPTTMTRHLWVRGPDVQELLRKVCARLPAWEDSELLEMAVEAEEHDEQVAAILRVAAGIPRSDPRALQVFEYYMTARHPLLRKATLQAIGYRLWREAVPLVEDAAKNDPDDGVRAFAQRILDRGTPAD